ncbi:hypothetical protein FOCC_FOCC013887 [Frankliniella occidentalis]|nr:hypothetical protein FOCC_FOCC013887 [Frankliniella occidentalis]
MIPQAKTTVPGSGSQGAAVVAVEAQPAAAAGPSVAQVGEDPLVNPDDPGVPSASRSSAATVAKAGAGLHGLERYSVKTDVTRADIIWCLHCVVNHSSASAGGKAVDLFPLMFPDSGIAARMQLGRLKIGYSVTYGLAPYFHDKVVQEIRESKCIVVMFDESLNKCSQENQMDLAVKFWSSSTNEVVTRYFDSAFLGRSRSPDLVAGFCSKFRGEQLDRLLMIAMDGPNVNFKFLREISVHLTAGDPDKPKLLEMGSCGLHVVHNSFKEGVKATGWGLVTYLRATYNVFKDVPARRAKYTEWTGSKKFPSKYCAVRWLNNAATADRGRDILPNMIEFVDKVEEGGRDDKIKSTSFSQVAKAVKDQLLGPKLAFFAFVARLVEPFLTAYQTNKPMAPYLHTDLSALVRDLYKLFVKKEYLKSKSDVCDVDVTKEENLIPAQEFSLSFSVKDALNKMTKPVPKKDMQKFKEECVALLKAMTAKLLEKSPLKYKLCKSITFCDPELIVKHEDSAISRLRSCLSALRRNNWLTAADCDKIESEFKLLIEKPSALASIKQFDRDTTRLDHFWRSIWETQKCSEALRDLLRMVLIISHGNAFVERGFSINKEITVENQLNVSLVAQRQVYDAVTLAGGIDSVVAAIDDKMIRRVRCARAEYEEARKKRAEEDRDKLKRKREEKRVAEEVRELRAKQAKLMQTAQIECEAIEDKLKALTS